MIVYFMLGLSNFLFTVSLVLIIYTSSKLTHLRDIARSVRELRRSLEEIREMRDTTNRLLVTVSEKLAEVKKSLEEELDEDRAGEEWKQGKNSDDDAEGD